MKKVFIPSSVDSMSSLSLVTAERSLTSISKTKSIVSQQISFEDSLTKNDVYRMRTYFPARNDIGINFSKFVGILKIAVRDTECTIDNALQLFNRCDVNNEGSVSWLDVINYLSDQYMLQDKSTSSVFASFQLPPFMKRPQAHIRFHMDLIGLYEIADDHVCMISSHGSIIEWNLQLRVRDSAVLYLPDPETIPHRKYRILDFCYISNLRKLILSTDVSELIFYETVPVFNFICRITSLTSIPLKLDCSLNQEGSYLLCYGDEEGCINCLHFPDFMKFIPSFRGVVNMEKQIFNFETLILNCVIEFNKWKVHSGPICEVQYIESINAVVSCSNDKYRSLVIGSIHGKKRIGKFHIQLSKHSTEYTSKSVVFIETASSTATAITNGAYVRTTEDEIVFNVIRGVVTFDFSEKSKYFVTGGIDQLLRVWNIDNQSHALQTQELIGHRRPISFVKFYETTFNFLISMSRDKEIRIWNAIMFNLIFTLVPYEYIIDDKIILKTALFSTKTEKLYVVADQVYVLRLIKHRLSKFPNTHQATVNCLVFRRATKVVITGDQNGVIKLWKLTTGHYLGECFCATEKSPVTYMMIDNQDLRLMSAHEDGYIRIWNLSSFQCTKIYRKSNEATITCMTYLNYKQFSWFVSAGWDRQLHFYSSFQNNGRRFQNPIFSIQDKAYYPYEGSFIMTGHILCMAEGPQNRIVVGCDDGEIHVWNVYEREMLKCLVIPPPNDYVPVSICHSGLDLRIHAVYFLWSRMKITDFQGGVLVTLGPYNRVHFWTYIIGDTRVIASFNPSYPGLKKTFSCCMEVTSDDCLLYTADGRGNIMAWDISNYAINSENTISNPPLKCLWTAHELPVTDLKIVNDKESSYVITVSVDCFIKLWTLNGTLIGTFGCDRWDLSTVSAVTVKNIIEKTSLTVDMSRISSSNITHKTEEEQSVISKLKIEKKTESSDVLIDPLTPLKIDISACERDFPELTANIPLERKRPAVQYVKDNLQFGAFHAREIIGDAPKPLELPIHPFINEMAAREFRRPFQNLSRNWLNSL